MILSILKPRWSFAKWFKLGFIIIITFIALSSFVSWQLVRPAGKVGENIAFVIAQGYTANEVSAQLASVGLIKSQFWFETWLWLTGNETKISSGYYSLPSNINIINLTHLITGGINNSEITVRLIEGWTIKEMAQYFEKQGLFTASDFTKSVTDQVRIDYIKDNIKGSILDALPKTTLEGYLFPDTYRIYHNVSADDMAIKMIETLESKFPIEWRERIKEKGYNVHQALTLASIVEKEVSSFEDRQKVANIFWKRLESNIGLQADSTINYITGKNLPAVTASDLGIDSSYNTYKYRGLPPGPISNPSLEAIRATVFPEETDYWYFLTTPTGQVIYSSTFDQHRQAKAKYLR